MIEDQEITTTANDKKNLVMVFATAPLETDGNSYNSIEVNKSFSEFCLSIYIYYLSTHL
jgi:hypothetical protein